jgi:hypothetical protein
VFTEEFRDAVVRTRSRRVGVADRDVRRAVVEFGFALDPVATHHVVRRREDDLVDPGLASGREHVVGAHDVRREDVRPRRARRGVAREVDDGVLAGERRPDRVVLGDVGDDRVVVGV